VCLKAQGDVADKAALDAIRPAGGVAECGSMQWRDATTDVP